MVYKAVWRCNISPPHLPAVKAVTTCLLKLFWRVETSCLKFLNFCFSIFGGKLGFFSFGTVLDRSAMSNLYGKFFLGASVDVSEG